MYTNIKTFEDACKALELDPANVLPDFSCYPEKHRTAMVAHAKLVIINQALNNGWTPNWDNYNQNKYYPWFDMSSGLSYYDFDCNRRDSVVGSRLCFFSSEVAKYAGTQFIDLYREYFLIN